MLFKSLEFNDLNGQKVKIVEIPVLEEGNTYQFMLGIRLETFIKKIMLQKDRNKVYSFKDYLKRVLKWTDYERLFMSEILKHNA